jgi:hypothetical protein
VDVVRVVLVPSAEDLRSAKSPAAASEAGLLRMTSTYVLSIDAFDV